MSTKEKGTVRKIHRPKSKKLDRQLNLAKMVSEDIERLLKDGGQISYLILLNALACRGVKLVDNWDGEDEPFWVYHNLTGKYPD